MQAEDLLLRQYEVEAPDLLARLAPYAARSREVRRRWPALLDLRYGPDEAERLDVFLAARPQGATAAPVLIYYHGGGWRGTRKEDRCFPAASICAAGAHFVTVEYPLAPRASLDQIVASARRALAFLHRCAGSFGGDPRRLYGTGNSAGAHLVGMLLAGGWAGAHGLPPSPLRGAFALSGIYDLAPLLRLRSHDYLRLDEETARRNSPIRQLCPADAAATSLLLAVGEAEPSEWHRQARDYLSAWRALGREGDMLVAPGCDHFSILGELDRPEGPLLRWMVRQMGLPSSLPLGP
jgi:arylformamidase